tara:strand:+ start:61 stop:429 length:369 start_codon:yes stop_codon:yes gene_type:complete
MELVEFMEECYAAQEALIAPKTPPATPQLPFDMVSKILQERRYLLQIENTKNNYKKVVNHEIFTSAAEFPDFDIKYYETCCPEECEDEFRGQFNKHDTKYYFYKSFAFWWIQEAAGWGCFFN